MISLTSTPQGVRSGERQGNSRAFWWYQSITLVWTAFIVSIIASAARNRDIRVFW
jgi:hypothetical protein